MDIKTLHEILLDCALKLCLYLTPMAPLLLNHSMITWKHWSSAFPPCLSSNSENTPPPLSCNLGQSYSIWLSMVLCEQYSALASFLEGVTAVFNLSTTGKAIDK